MNFQKERKILKASGTEELFDESKVYKYLISSGISPDLAQKAITYLENNINRIDSTYTIYEHISRFLRDHGSLENYFNYSLKRAVMELGPSGHPFEILVADVLATKGYRTEVGVVALGKCVTHEIDVVAAKEKKHHFIECKFHNAPGVKTDVQVALYTYARFLDVKLAMENTHELEKEYLSWLITNTKVTTEVFDYARCVGLEITAWYLPEGRGLRDLIMSSGLHPVTVLDKLSARQLNQLIDRGIVTCARVKTAIEQNQVRDILNTQQAEQILKDISTFCH